MDESALNYNSDATVDDGSCEYESVDCDYELITVGMIDSMAMVGMEPMTVAGQTVTLESGSNGTATVCIDMSVILTVSEGAWPSEV